MNELNEIKVKQKSFSDSDICRNKENRNVASQKTEMAKLTGITTSQIRKREKLSETPAYCFLKKDELEADIPIIFRIKDKKGNWTKPKIPKYSYLEVQGNYAKSDKSTRSSFTAYNYQILNPDFPKEAKVVELSKERNIF